MSHQLGKPECTVCGEQKNLKWCNDCKDWFCDGKDGCYDWTSSHDDMCKEIFYYRHPEYAQETIQGKCLP